MTIISAGTLCAEPRNLKPGVPRSYNIGTYQLGGLANQSFLQPTAGREALSRESINQVTQLVGLAEWAASQFLATSALADRNNPFVQWVTNNNKFVLAGKIAVRLLPGDKDIPWATFSPMLVRGPSTTIPGQIAISSLPFRTKDYFSYTLYRATLAAMCNSITCKTF